MAGLLWLIPALPLAGFLVLALAGPRLSRGVVAFTGAGSVGMSAVLSLIVGISFVSSPPSGHAWSQTLWTWMSIGGFTPKITLYLDALSVVMMTVITFVGFLIHLYSTEFMMDEEGYSRFFAYMNLFVGSMLILVLADNLLFLYVGWEGVGLCSYLLIGFWYKDPANVRAAMKAFIVTRIGDTALAIGLFLLYNNLGTLHIQELMLRAEAEWPAGSVLAVWAAALLLGGAVGKSAQLPLQTWLPDAMAGPTPVSALIHAATMVTAGVYLIARTNVIFSLAPSVQAAVSVIGALTLIIAGSSALTQRDIKRVLAYSTISQIGYMFLALGVGAWSAAMFHFMTHAFFKALLFLGAGVVIMGLDHEHDMFRMGGLRKEFPLTFWTFLVGASSLSALPLVTAGFYSKDLILWEAWASKSGSLWLWAAGSAGAVITSLYTFRMVFLTFFGEPKTAVIKRPGMRMKIPLAALAFFSITAGFVELPPVFGNLQFFSAFMESVLPLPLNAALSSGTEPALMTAAGLLSLAGVYIAYILYLKSPGHLLSISEGRTAGLLQRLWFSGWGFDRVYDTLFVRPFVWLAKINKDDFFDLAYLGIAWYNRIFSKWLGLTQTGKIRLYAMGIALGAVVALALLVSG